MIPSNQAWWALLKQTAKGTPGTAPTFKAPFSAGTRPKAGKTFAQLSETDSARDEGVDYITKATAAGAPEAYGRDSYAHFLLEAALGSRTTAGTTNYTHTITPASTLAYYTLWSMLGNTIWEETDDAFVNTLTMKAGAGAPLTIALDFLGITQKHLTADPSVAVNLANDQVYTYNDATVTMSGGATAFVSDFTLTYSNAVTDAQTNNIAPIDLVLGKRSATLDFTMYFNDATEYNQFYYGTAAPAANATASNTVRTTDLDFLFSHGTNNSIELAFPRIQIEDFPVDPNANGQPIQVAVKGRAQRGGTPILTATVKNQVA